MLVIFITVKCFLRDKFLGHRFWAKKFTAQALKDRLLSSKRTSTFGSNSIRGFVKHYDFTDALRRRRDSNSLQCGLVIKSNENIAANNTLNQFGNHLRVADYFFIVNHKRCARNCVNFGRKIGISNSAEVND